MDKKTKDRIIRYCMKDVEEDEVWYKWYSEVEGDELMSKRIKDYQYEEGLQECKRWLENEN